MYNFNEAIQWLEEEGFTIELENGYWNITNPDGQKIIRTTWKRDITFLVSELLNMRDIRKNATLGVLAKSCCSVDVSPNQKFYRSHRMPELLNAKPCDIVEGRWQPRKNYDLEELAELAESIKANGLVSRPIVFVNERKKLELISGHRRALAAIIAGLEHIPVEVRTLTARQAMEHSLVDNFNRVDLTPMEEAQAYKIMLNILDISQVKLAKRLGITRGKIQQRLELIDAAPELIRALDSGEITLGVARGILSITKGSVNIQKETLRVLPEVYITKMNERAARETAFGVLMSLHYPTESDPTILEQLRGLGWSVGQVNLYVSKNEKIYCYRIWSHDTKPFWKNAKEVAAIIDAGLTIEQPEYQSITDLTLVLARLFKIEYSEQFEPWIRQGNKYMSRQEFGAQVAEEAEKLDELMARYQEQGYSLGVAANPARIIIYDSEGAQAWYTYNYDDALRKADNFDEFLEGREIKRRKCIECGSGQGLASGYDDDWQSKGYESGWNYFCETCLAKIKKKKKENKQKTIKQIKDKFNFVSKLDRKQKELLAAALGCEPDNKKLLTFLANQVFAKARHNLVHLLNSTGATE